MSTQYKKRDSLFVTVAVVTLITGTLTTLAFTTSEIGNQRAACRSSETPGCDAPQIAESIAAKPVTLPTLAHSHHRND